MPIDKLEIKARDGYIDDVGFRQILIAKVNELVEALSAGHSVPSRALENSNPQTSSNIELDHTEIIKVVDAQYDARIRKIESQIISHGIKIGQLTKKL